MSDATAPQPQTMAHAMTFDSKAWQLDRDADYNKRQFELVRAAAEAPFTSRNAARLDLARFYLSRQFYPEAKAVLDTMIADDRPTADDPAPLVLRAVTNIMLGRADAAQKDLANPVVGNQNDAPLWRALAFARAGKWAEARDAFRTVEGALGALPLELQRMALKDALRASVEIGDVTGATNRINDFKVVGLSTDLEPAVSVLAGRLAERSGRVPEALAAYRIAAASSDGPAAAQGRLREIALRYSQGETNKADTIRALENLTIAWRGDETEVEALQLLARLYTEEDRYRDAFHVMRTALTAFPDSPLTRGIQTEAAKTFDTLFLAGKGDALPAVDALGLFYDFRDLTPIGRRGDEMIRRLAERLVSVDLLDQAAELLQYQVDNRLQGAARAQVATRLAVIELMNHKPQNAQAVLRATRTADLANEIRVPRLMIEARALSDIGRHDFALEVIAGLEGRETLRLRADIYWASRQWQKAAEHIELLYGDRWKSFEPLTDAERADMLRAGVAYALAEDKIGISRLRDKYAAKMKQGPDGRAFDVVTGGLGAEQPRIPRGGADRRLRRHAAGVPPRAEDALSGDAGPAAGRRQRAPAARAESRQARCRADRLDPHQDAEARFGAVVQHHPLSRHARPCAGHPRLAFLSAKGVDGRDIGERSDAVLRMAMPGHDEHCARRSQAADARLRSVPGVIARRNRVDAPIAVVGGGVAAAPPRLGGPPRHGPAVSALCSSRTRWLASHACAGVNRFGAGPAFARGSAWPRAGAARQRILRRRRMLHRLREMPELPRRARHHAGLRAGSAPRGARGGALRLGGRLRVGGSRKLARDVGEGRDHALRRRRIERRRPRAGAAHAERGAGPALRGVARPAAERAHPDLHGAFGAARDRRDLAQRQARALIERDQQRVVARPQRAIALRRERG